MSCSSAAAAQALLARRGVLVAKRLGPACVGAPFLAIAPEQGEGRLPVRGFGCDTRAWLVEEPS